MQMCVTADGVLFHLGMSLYTEYGEEKVTSADTHEIVETQYYIDGVEEKAFSIGYEGCSVHHDLRLFFSSKDAAINHKINGLLEKRADIDSQIEYWKGLI